MTALMGLLAPLQFINDHVLRLGRAIGIVAIGLMVVCILIQVFMRYVMNNALPWPDEAARFLMLWMTGLMAPSAYRRGGFVAIDMIERFLPPRVVAGLALFLLALSLMVLIVGLQLSLKHVSSGWLFSSSSLWIPLDWIGAKSFKLKLAWMYMSLTVGIVLLIAVSAELILRQLITMLGGGERLTPLAVYEGAD